MTSPLAPLFASLAAIIGVSVFLAWASWLERTSPRPKRRHPVDG